MPGEKKYYCITCNSQEGMTVALLKDSKSGELVCKLNPKHKFKVTKSGFLETLPEQ